MDGPFSLSAAPNTDVWRKPPNTDVFNAPTTSLKSATAKGPLSSFVSARLSFRFAWSEQYDQAGLLLTFQKKTDGEQPRREENQSPAKWIKTGVEFYDGAPRLSTVACDSWADWSVAPLEAGPSVWTSVLIESAGDHHGASLWVYRVLEDGQKVPLREVCWVYGDGDADKWEIGVAALAARPSKDTKESLKVDLRDFEVVWSKN